jgi:hypothetical protein
VSTLGIGIIVAWLPLALVTGWFVYRIARLDGAARSTAGVRVNRLVLAAFCFLVSTGSASSLTLDVSGPESVAAVARQIRAIDPLHIQQALASAGLDAPTTVRVALVPEADPLARATPRWIVAFAGGTEQITIFPARVGPYPYPSLESVVTHEVAHLSLEIAAHGGRLPRWFHEGVAVSVESGWSVLNDARLLMASFSRSGLDDLRALFAADDAHQSEAAYLLATAVVADVRDRHGADAPGRIARRVGSGLPFDEAFARETGETPDAAANRAWAVYRRWRAWLPFLTDGTVLWSGILLLALLAFVVNWRKRRRRRRQWDDDEPGWTSQD